MGDRAEAVFELSDVFRGPPAVVQAQIEKRRSTEAYSVGICVHFRESIL